MARKLRTERRAPESKPARNKGAKALKDTAQVDLLPELRQAYPGIFDECRDALVWPGWVTLVRELAAELASSAPDARVDQIKSKFGELRAYTSAIKAQSLVAHTSSGPARSASCVGLPGCAPGPGTRPGPPSLALDDLPSLRGQAMRILIVGDVHGDFSTLLALLRREQPDLVLKSGTSEFGRPPWTVSRNSGPWTWRRSTSARATTSTTRPSGRNGRALA
jgi:hypothetical protein